MTGISKFQADELAERCEQATGPDRELDAEIAVTAFGFFVAEPRYEGAPVAYGYIDKDGCRIEPGHGGKQLIREFTASLDAAMTLAEPFMLVALSDIAADGLTGCCLCSDTSTNPPKEHWGIPIECSGDRQGILARAVCAAALRARAAQSNEGGE